MAWRKSLKTVTAHCSAAWKFTLGVMTQVLGAPSTTVASLCRPVTLQLMLYQPALTSTWVVKVTMMVASRGALTPFAGGSVFTTEGAIGAMTAVRRGFGVPVMKSLPLTLVSVLPPFLQPVAWALPPTYVFEGMRALLIDQVFRADLMLEAFGLNLIFMAVAVAAFLNLVASARNQGSLLHAGE